MRLLRAMWLILIVLAIAFACAPFPKEVETSPAVKAQRFPAESFDGIIDEHADSLIEKDCHRA